MHVLIFILFSIILFLQVIIQPNPSLIGFWQMAIKRVFGDTHHIFLVPITQISLKNFIH